MRYLNIEDRSQRAEQEADDILTEFAHEVTNDLTYNHYRWQRSFYGIAAERLAPHYPRADKYEERYQEEIKRKAA